MTLLLHDLPYLDTSSFVEVNHQAVQVLPHQIVVWVSLSPRGVFALDPSTPRFPAILDTGNSFGFALAEKHLEQWSALPRQAVEQLGSISINRISLPRLATAVWLHPNRKGERDAFRRQPPFRLALRDGIAVYPLAVDQQAPRLPLLGLRALDENALRCAIHGDRLRVTLRTPPTPRRASSTASP